MNQSKSEILFIIIIFGALLVLSELAVAQNLNITEDQLRSVYLISKQYKVDSNDLLKIAYVESNFNAKAIRNNKNGTVDYGMFQINSVHWNTTCKDLNVFKFKGNCACAARLLASNKKYAGRDPHWKARYHSKTPKLKRIYSNKLANIDLHKALWK